MERIGRSHALLRAIKFSPSILKTSDASLCLATPTARSFSSSGNPLQNESEVRPSTAKIIKSPSQPRMRPPYRSRRIPNGAVDARSLGAAQAGEGTVISAPLLQLKQSLLRARAGAAKSGTRRRPGGKKGNAAVKRTRRRRSDDEEGADGREEDIEAVFAEIRNQSRPKSTTYTPVQYDVASLKNTWPALPIGKTTASTGAVLERMSLMSHRYANGYVPPQELARRLFQGKRVLFSSEEEKSQVMEEVAKLAQERANKISQRKGNFVEPTNASFMPINEEERKTLVGQLVRGNYENWQQGDTRHPVLDEVQRQLYNNETYRITGKQSKFMTKFQSLLASSQRTKTNRA